MLSTSQSLAVPRSSLFLLPPSARRRLPVRAAVSVPPASPSAPDTLYDVLGVAAAASGLEIKAAYRRLARACHPDAVVAADRKTASADEFMRIHAAYETLSDPEKRAEYDRGVVVADRRWRPFHSSRSSYSFYAGRRQPRTWETDQCW
ncbi:chaperone protein dnaJ 11, chloroplastic-like [Zingiber officinale]|nr:chaperone protein dnaJ 11, chloroplastic-like [Zingiber officinale]